MSKYRRSAQRSSDEGSFTSIGKPSYRQSTLAAQARKRTLKRYAVLGAQSLAILATFCIFAMLSTSFKHEQSDHRGLTGLSDFVDFLKNLTTACDEHISVGYVKDCAACTKACVKHKEKNNGYAEGCETCKENKATHYATYRGNSDSCRNYLHDNRKWEKTQISELLACVNLTQKRMFSTLDEGETRISYNGKVLADLNELQRQLCKAMNAMSGW